MDDTTTRIPRAAGTQTELPQSLAWLSDPADPAAEPALDLQDPTPAETDAEPAEPAPKAEPDAQAEQAEQAEPDPDPIDQEGVRLDDPALRPLWSAARNAARSPGDALVQVRGLDRSGGEALARLLGRRAARSAARIDLSELERVVEHRTGLPLAAVLDDLAPPVESSRRARTDARTAPLRAGQDWLEAHPTLAARSWTVTWLETVRREVAAETGLSTYEVIIALELLAAITAPDTRDGPAWRSRTELAAQVAGEPHALDEGSAVAALVLRGLAAACGTAMPADGAGRRRLWSRFGVLTDLVTAPCLAVGVAPLDTALPRWRDAGTAGWPLHVTARDLRAAPGPWAAAATDWEAVLVLDSPSAFEAVADRFAGRIACVATDGVPGPVTLDLLGRLHASGTALRFTTGFDEPGLAVGSLLADRFGATPWRMTPEVYGEAARCDLSPLGARLPTVGWAEGLSEAMAREGRAVPLEQVLEELLTALDTELAGDGGDRGDG